jgi:glutamate synthase domain-containing protein 2
VIFLFFTKFINYFMENIATFFSSISWWFWLLLLLLGIGIRDVLQKTHTIKHNFPLIGHLRYLLESIGPEIRQYFVANNREELPFNRRQRSWIYASSKKENNFQGFGTDQDMASPGYIFIKPAMFTYKLPPNHVNLQEPSTIPCAKVMGLANGRRHPYRPGSVVNISGMSYGSLSSTAVQSLNMGAKKFGCYHNTGEGSLSPYHSNGADVILNIGTAYFGVRDATGRFSMEKLQQMVAQNPFIRAIELKLSQGAKPGKGGVLPAAKITDEIAKIRQIPMGVDVISPAYHSEFSNVPEMLDFIEKIAQATGLPVGIKSAVGKLEQWEELAELMVKRGTGPDFIAIDGGEGGTGAAPPAFADHVSLPFTFAFSKVYKIFLRAGLSDKIVFIGSGKLGLPANALMAFAMGCDLVAVAREAMMSIGCIQAQICHTNRCPSGVATTNNWLKSGIDPTLKSERVYHYFKTLNKEILEVTHACGYEHPCQLKMKDVDIAIGDENATVSLEKSYGYQKQVVPFVNMQKLIENRY